MTPEGDPITAQNYDQATLRNPNEGMPETKLRIQRRAAYKLGKVSAETLMADPYDNLWLQWWNVDPQNLA